MIVDASVIINAVADSGARGQVARAARPLEIVTVQEEDGSEVVIHAMKLRSKYYPRGGRA